MSTKKRKVEVKVEKAEGTESRGEGAEEKESGSNGTDRSYLSHESHLSHASSAAMRGLQANVWPGPDAMESFYGKMEMGPEGLPTARWVARSTQRIHLPLSLRLRVRPELVVRRLRCHRRLIPSLHRIFAAIAEVYAGREEVLRAAEGDLFGGCYLEMTAEAALHPHAYGAAIRLGGEAGAPAEVVAIFAAEGWVRVGPGMFAAVSK